MPYGDIYGLHAGLVAAAKARREKAARKVAESWARLRAAFASSRAPKPREG
jgi:hypothetical protein